jgi:hypothetical protein
MMAPRATKSTAHTATRPSHSTLAPTPSGRSLAPTVTSQPRAWGIPMARAGASTLPDGRPPGGVLPGETPPGSGTGSCGHQPPAGASTAASRAPRSSSDAGSVPGPPAHITTRPSDHDAWSRTSPGPSRVRGSASSALVPVRRWRAVARRDRSCSKSATTWSRSGPVIVRTLARSASVWRRSRARPARHSRGWASSRASCAAVASPAASASMAHASSCSDTLAGAGAGRVSTLTGPVWPSTTATSCMCLRHFGAEGRRSYRISPRCICSSRAGASALEATVRHSYAARRPDGRASQESSR